MVSSYVKFVELVELSDREVLWGERMKLDSHFGSEIRTLGSFCPSPTPRGSVSSLQRPKRGTFCPRLVSLRMFPQSWSRPSWQVFIKPETSPNCDLRCQTSFLSIGVQVLG